MRWREGEEVDPHHPYTEGTHIMLDVAYGMSVPIGLLAIAVVGDQRVA